MAEPAYFIAQIQVDDWDAIMPEYGPRAMGNLMKHNIKVLVDGPGATTLEGQWAGNHTVVIEFETREAIEDWNNSSEYAAARPFRFDTTSLNNIVTADGL